jgi:tungstate transport system substrate-binding protein
MKSGVEAFRKIAQAEAPFLDALDIGSREVCHSLWKMAGIKPAGSWILRDDAKDPHNIVTFAQKQNAYVVFGRMPILFKKVPFGTMQIMVESDPAMRRPYIVMEANPKRFPDTNQEGARALSDFLLSEEVQKFLAGFGTKEYGGIPLFHPVWPVAGSQS